MNKLALKQKTDCQEIIVYLSKEPSDYHEAADFIIEIWKENNGKIKSGILTILEKYKKDKEWYSILSFLKDHSKYLEIDEESLENFGEIENEEEFNTQMSQYVDKLISQS